jgi:nucleotide-binding universal stress UspA family protein
MRRVLVALDDTEASERAAHFVNEFFDGLDVEVLGISVAEVPRTWIPESVGFGAVYPWGFAGGVPPEALTAGLAAAEDHAEQTLRRTELEADERIVERGDPVEAINAAAEAQDVDLVVVGSHDKGIVDRLIEGSVSHELVRKARRPVLIVR